MKKKIRTRDIVTILIGLIIVVAITYSAALAQTMKENSDYYFHATWSRIISIHHLDTFFKTYKVFYPIWHFMVFFCYRIGCSIETASAMVAALTNMFLFFIIIFYFKEKTDWNGYLRSASAVMLLLIQPLWIGMGYAVTMGHFSPNEWRNPTTLVARPFGMIAFICLAKLLEEPEKGKKKKFLIYIIASSLSVLAKPSFLQMFIPGIGIYMIFELIMSKNKKKELLIEYSKIAVASIPAVLIIFFQFFCNFGDNNHLGISWLEYWSTHTHSMTLSMLMAFAFPIYFLIIDHKRLFSLIEVRLAIAMQTVAWMEGALLIETGSRRLHGNFVWANSLAMFLLFAVLMKEFLFYTAQNRNSENKVKIWIGWGILLLHLVSGIHWVLQYIIVV